MDRSLEFVDAMPFGIKRLEESISRSLKAIEDPDVRMMSHCSVVQTLVDDFQLMFVCRSVSDPPLSLC
jgi:hypothetical protein